MCIRDRFNAYLVDGQDDDVWEETKRLNGEAKMSHLLGFYFDDTNVTVSYTHLI